MKHEGFRKDRLNHPDFSAKERAFAKEWADSVHTTPSSKGDYHILEALVPNATERDAAVAATIIQWLGTNVGSSFLSHVIESNPEIFEFQITCSYERIKKELRERSRYQRAHI